MEFKELRVEEMMRGYVRSAEGIYTCIFCGETFEEGIIYPVGEQMYTAERAICEHIFEAHGGVFYGLLHLDKQVSGISDAQKAILEGMYLEQDNKTIGENLSISAATVRTHKFNIQRMKREARILLSLLAQIEDPQRIAVRRQMEATHADQTEEKDAERSLTANNLHPFFTQFNLK